MSISHFTDTARCALGEATPVAVPLGEPVAATRCISEARTDGVETGIWECSPGRWRRHIVQQEFCHFISGHCTFTPDGGEPIEIRAGDAILFPQGTTGIWDIHETVRKSFVLIG